ncbi:hypothetical protein RHA1_ro10270 (plasmid) [Rhodococcus jostii RHA1]|uniref:Uncharacterized protein n=1 Tax=Rhodococcus jostii (strain RHA1) TaxID=101510 RepID=Q0RW73_RHOJR|nr:hypothetical protein RHA1_ro10270 [Rhodococcus jostii RHA1]
MVLHRVTLVGLSKSHAMATFVGYDTPVRCGTASYTIFMDATPRCTRYPRHTANDDNETLTRLPPTHAVAPTSRAVSRFLRRRQCQN